MRDFYDETPSKGKGYGTRYDTGIPSDIDRERRKHNATGVFMEYKTRRCTGCKKRKPVKGGTNKNHKFICADCNIKLAT